MTAPASERQREAILKALRIFVPENQVTELRAFKDRETIASVFFRDHDALARRAVVLDREYQASGIYFVPNPVRDDMVGSNAISASGSTNAQLVTARRWILIDVDPARYAAPGERLPNNRPSTEEERTAAWDIVCTAREVMEQAGFQGAVIADSGNGWHACFPVDLPNDAESYALISDLLAGLQLRCGNEFGEIDQACKDAPRIWKLYCTNTRKGTAAPNRPFRWARVVEGEAPTQEIRLHNNERLKRLIGIWRQQAPPQPVSTGPMDAVARARAYLAKEDPAVDGQEGSKRCYHVAGILIHGFGLTIEQAFEAIADWNARCSPPWSEKELRHKFQSVQKKPSREPIGHLLNAERAKSARMPNEPQEGSDEEEPLVVQASTIEPRKVEWLWPGTIPMGNLTTFAGNGGLGKCVAKGTRVLTTDGYVPIESLRPADAGPGATPMRVEVVTAHGFMHTSHFYDGGIQQTLRLRTKAGYQITGTREHPLLCYLPDLSFGWMKMEDIESGLQVVTVRDNANTIDHLIWNFNGSFSWDEVVSVEPAGEQQVYDLTVPEGYSFIANGIVSHNTFVLCDLSSRVSRGMDWPDGTTGGQSGQVLFISGEDDPEDTLVPRMIELGADLEKIYFMRPKAQGKFTLADVPMLEKAMLQCGSDVRFIVVDPPTAYLGGVNDHNNAELMQLLTPLAAMAQRYHVAIVFNTHVNKGQGGTNTSAMSRVIGSVAWVNKVRAAYIFVRDPDDGDRRLFLPLKNNLAKERPGLAYRIVAVADDLARVEWIGDVGTTADQAVNATPKKRKRDEVAADWLIARFTERLEWSSEDLFAAAKEHGIGKNAIFEAKDKLQLPPARRRTLGTGDVVWVWAVPADWPYLTRKEATETPKVEEIQPVAGETERAF